MKYCFPSGNLHGKRKNIYIKEKIQCQSKLALCITGITLRKQE